MIQQFARSQGPVLGFRFTGRFTAADHASITPLVDRAVGRHGRVRLLMQFDGLDGWNFAGFWRELRFTAQHFADVERLAIVGEAPRDEWFAVLAKPFTAAEVRYFDATGLGRAWRWLEEEAAGPERALLHPLDDPAPATDGPARPLVLG